MSFIKIEVTDEDLELDRNVVEVLVEHLAQYQARIGYNELVGLVNERHRANINPKDVYASLGRIQRYCKACAVPTLSSIVCGSGETVPSSGFYRVYHQLFPDVARLRDDEIAHAAQNVCFEYGGWQTLYSYLGISTPAPATQ